MTIARPSQRCSARAPLAPVPDASSTLTTGAPHGLVAGQAFSFADAAGLADEPHHPHRTR
jgi:hypothetical protein